MEKHWAIYFTEEKGRKKLLGVSEGNSLRLLTSVSIEEKKIFQRTLGHSFKNLFVNIDGYEYELI